MKGFDPLQMLTTVYDNFIYILLTNILNIVVGFNR